MELSQFTIERLCKIIDGDTQIMPYLSGPQLVELYNRHGGRDTYGQGFPSRWVYAKQILEGLNGTAELSALIEETLDPRAFFDTELDQDSAMGKINELLQYDGYRVTHKGAGVRVVSVDSGMVVPQSLAKVEDDYVTDQVSKCDEKMSAGDYDGAITNARTLVETIVVDILSTYDKDYVHKGDLVAAYKRLKAILNLDPSAKEYPESVKQVLAGLNSVIVGLSAIRNEMSDAHRRRHKPDRHHAQLAVNASKTLADFLLDSLVKQYGASERTE